jgi:hypothetical protein
MRRLLTVFFWELFQAYDDVVFRGVDPRALRYKCCAHGREFFVVEDPTGTSFDIDDISGIQQSFGGRRSYWLWLA